MDNLGKGVYIAKKKDNSIYYRSSITFRRKHISLGSFSNANDANKAYEEARNIINSSVSIDDYSASYTMSFDKFVVLINFRDNKMYIANPIYIRPKFFYYYYSQTVVLKFDVDDLFYYSFHKIMKRGNHFFVADYGMQVNIASRYGIKNHSVLNKDYRFINGDRLDFRYSNIEITNTYNGVRVVFNNKKTRYKAVIHIKGNFVIGTYDSKEKAAIAYNKAANIINNKGCKKNYSYNYIENMSQSEYEQLYNEISISSKITDLDRSYFTE